MEQFCRNPNKHTIGLLDSNTLKFLYKAALYVVENRYQGDSTWNVKLAQEIVNYFNNKKVICSDNSCHQSIKADKKRKYGSKEFFSVYECEETCLDKVSKDVHVYIEYPENFPGIKKISKDDHNFYSTEYMMAQFKFYSNLEKKISKYRREVQYVKIIPKRDQITVWFSTFYSFTENDIRDLFTSIGYGKYITRIHIRMYSRPKPKMTSKYQHQVYSLDSFKKNNIKHFIVIEAKYKHSSTTKPFNEDVFCEKATKFFNDENIACYVSENGSGHYDLHIEIPYVITTVKKAKFFIDNFVGKNGTTKIYENFLN